MIASMKYIWPIPGGRPRAKMLAGVAATAVILVWAAHASELDLLRWLRSCADVVRFLSHMLVVPDWGYVPTLAARLWETIEITLLASFLSVTISLPLSILAARNASPHAACSRLTRLSLCFIRALPELVWALLFVSAFGLGPVPGVLAMAIVSTGFMGRFYAESLEVVDRRVVDAVRASGARWGQVRLYGMFPQAMPDLVGSTLYLLDHNLRAATLLGLVGAGGIGYDMIVTLRLFRFDRLILIVASIYLIIFALDRASHRIRRKVI